jgi:hypothetical protein
MRPVALDGSCLKACSNFSNNIFLREIIQDIDRGTGGVVAKIK